MHLLMHKQTFAARSAMQPSFSYWRDLAVNLLPNGLQMVELDTLTD